MGKMCKFLNINVGSFVKFVRYHRHMRTFSQAWFGYFLLFLDPGSAAAEERINAAAASENPTSASEKSRRQS